MFYKPFIIGIAGANSSCGKTSLACALISHLAAGHPFAPVGVKPRIGAIKFTKEKTSSSLIEDDTILRESGKDSARFYEAGACKVLWARSPSESQDEILTLAIDRLSDCGCIIIEGNSAIEFAKPDIVIFITVSPGHETKPSGTRLSGQADIIISHGVIHPAYPDAIVLKDLPYRLNDNETKVIIKLMEDTAKKKELAALLGARAEAGKLTCTAARKIAEELNTSYAEVGAAADRLRIKIKNCELGCF
jgi:molybdopterin-guanine dinucleotide biosynthesis protein